MAGSPVASTRASALSRALSSRVSPVSSTSATDGGPGHELDPVAHGVGHEGHDLGRLVRVGGGQHHAQPPGRRRRRCPSPSPAGRHRGAGGSATTARCASRSTAMPLLGQAHELVELAAGEGHALGRALHLDEASRPGHHDVHVHLGPRVLGVVEVQQAGPVDHAHRHRGTGVGERVRREHAASGPAG